jgi:hypothetical protein
MPGKNTKKWRDLTPVQQRTIVVAGVAELVMTSIPLRDLAKRPSAQVRGPKALWLLACFVQPVGPIAYLTVGRGTRTH